MGPLQGAERARRLLWPGSSAHTHGVAPRAGPGWLGSRLSSFRLGFWLGFWILDLDFGFDFDFDFDLALILVLIGFGWIRLDFGWIRFDFDWIRLDFVTSPSRS